MNHYFLLFMFTLLSILSTCDENAENFTLGEEFIESQTDINLIDTFSVVLSTVILDKVETSGTENMLVGNYEDNLLGEIYCDSYFQIGTANSIDIEYGDSYDSLYLVLKYNGYFLGDTSQSQKISVYQLAENIVTEADEVLTNQSTFSYNPNPIGAVIFNPQTISDEDNVLIKIDDNIGLDLFSKINEESEIITNNELFIDYFHGLVLKADETNQKLVVGFNASKDDVKLVLCTTRFGEYGDEEIRNEFTMGDSTKQFNHISYDLSSTLLKPLVEQRYELPTTNTNGRAFLQAGIGLLIRVDFPSLSNILMFQQGTIVKAELTVLSSNIDNKDRELNSSLLLYKSDKINRVQTSIASASKITTGESYEEEITYTFDITDYLKDELDDLYFAPEESGLLITLSSNTLGSTLERLIIDNKSPKTKLKIYYLTY